MSYERWSAVDGYIAELLLEDDPALDSASAESSAAGLPAIAVSPPQGKLLHLLARLCEARRILELGTLGGYSTIWLARALPRDGTLITIEVSPDYARVARANIAAAGVEGVVDLRVGAALELLPALTSEQVSPFDMIFIDADKQNTPEYFDWAMSLSHPGTLIVVDNVVRAGALVDRDDRDPRVEGMRRFHEHVAREPRVDATTIQTVGVKGYDGFTVALVHSGFDARSR